MSGDVGDFWRDVQNARREAKHKHGIDCPGCVQHHPKRIPTLLLPGHRCRVCKHVDSRPFRSLHDLIQEA